MAETESLRQVAQSRAPFSAWVGILGLFLIFGLIVLALVGPSVRTDHYEQGRAQKRVDNLKKLQEEDVKALTTYAWVDKAKGSAHIPIERAMELSLKELAQKKPAVAYAIAPDATAAAPAAPANATPAPGAGNPGASPAPKAKEIEGPNSENKSQPAAANNPPNVQPGTQPGAGAAPAAKPAPPSGAPAVSPTGTPAQSPPGSPLPVRGKTSMNTFKNYGCC